MLVVAKTKREAGIELVEVPVPTLTADNQVLIEVKACGICGSDLEFYLWEPKAERRFARVSLPMILGHEPSGIVVEVGKGVLDFKIGDRVACDLAVGCGFCYYCRRGLFNLCDNRYVARGSGGFGQYLLTTSASTFKIPDDIPFEHAACLEPLGVALHGIERSHLKPGDYAVVIGPGPLGLLTAMSARASGASKVVVAGRATSSSRLKLSTELGFETLIVGEPGFQEKIWSETGGRGADVVFDCAGGCASLREASRAVRKGGEIILVGMGPEGEFDADDIMLRELTIIGSKSLLPSTFDRAISLVSAGKIDVAPIVTHVLPLVDAVKGFEALVERRALKAVLVPGMGS